MDESRFDDLSRRLAGRPSRRAALGLLTALGLAAADPADARRRRNRCRGKCGGNCPRCPNGKPCDSRDDCRSALCFAGACGECADGLCKTGDHSGQCFCHPVTKGCVKREPAFRVGDCADCPAGSACHPTDDPDEIGCHFPCGGTNYCRAGADACKAEAACEGGGECFQPLGGGPTQCGTSLDNTCGCTSHRSCAERFGPGAFCVKITGPNCTCGGATTFCARSA